MLAAYTLIHVLISLVAIAAGFMMIGGMLSRANSPLATNVFLVTAILTTLTGFGFPATEVTPAHITGVVAAIVLVAVLLAQFKFHYAGIWRPIYAGGIVASLYLLVFVGIVQTFLKIPVVNTLAPTGGEPPFAITQGLVLLLFIALGVAAVRAFQPAPAGAALAE